MDKKVGARIKMARIEAGLTQTEFGEKVGVSTVMVSRYEGGKSSALRKIDKIAEVLGKDVDYFFASETEKDSLYSEVKELVKILREKTEKYEWPFSAGVPLLSVTDLANFSDVKVLEMHESSDKVSCNSEILKSDPEAFAIKVDSNFHKTIFPKGTIVIISPNIKTDNRDYVLKYGKNGASIGRKGTVRGKLIGKVVETRLV